MGEYCEAAAAVFDFTPEHLSVEGGEGFDHRHEWHDAHKGFVDMIEGLLAEVLAIEGVDRQAFINECHAALSTPEQAPTMLRMFLSMLLESGDYLKFVGLMKQM